MSIEDSCIEATVLIHVLMQLCADAANRNGNREWTVGDCDRQNNG